MLCRLDQCQLFLQTWAQQTRPWASLASLRYGTSKMIRQCHLPLLHQDHYLKKRAKMVIFCRMLYIKNVDNPTTSKLLTSENDL